MIPPALWTDAEAWRHLCIPGLFQAPTLVAASYVPHLLAVESFLTDLESKGQVIDTIVIRLQAYFCGSQENELEIKLHLRSA